MGELYEGFKLAGIMVSAVSGLYVVLRGVGNLFLLEKITKDHEAGISAIRQELGQVKEAIEEHMRQADRRDSRIETLSEKLRELVERFERRRK